MTDDRSPSQIERDRASVRRLLWIAFAADVALAAVLLAIGQVLAAVIILIVGGLLTVLTTRRFR